jgi:hypothetical protein
MAELGAQCRGVALQWNPVTIIVGIDRRDRGQLFERCKIYPCLGSKQPSARRDDVTAFETRGSQAERLRIGKFSAEIQRAGETEQLCECYATCAQPYAQFGGTFGSAQPLRSRAFQIGRRQQKNTSSQSALNNIASRSLWRIAVKSYSFFKSSTQDDEPTQANSIPHFALLCAPPDCGLAANESNGMRPHFDVGPFARAISLRDEIGERGSSTKRLKERPGNGVNSLRSRRFPLSMRVTVIRNSAPQYRREAE